MCRCARFKRIERTPVPSVVQSARRFSVRTACFAMNACFGLFSTCWAAHSAPGTHSSLCAIREEKPTSKLYQSKLKIGSKNALSCLFAARITTQKFSQLYFRREHWWHTFYSRLYIPLSSSLRGGLRAPAGHAPPPPPEPPWSWWEVRVGKLRVAVWTSSSVTRLWWL